MQRNAATEKTSLIHSEEQPSSCSAKQVILYAVKGGLVVVGFGAGALYLGPVDTCIATESCGKWMAEALSKMVATGVFLSGGFVFGCINAYFSGKSVPELMEYVEKQPTLFEKSWKTLVIVTYATTQDLQLLLAALSTSTNALTTTVTVLGGAPSALYSGTKLMDERIPYLASHASLLMKRASLSLRGCFSTLSDADLRERERLCFYQKQQAVMLEMLHAKWRHVVAHASTIPFDPAEDPLIFLARQEIAPVNDSLMVSAARKLSVVSGLTISFFLSYPFVMNSFSLLQRFVPTLPLQILATAYLSSGSLYSNIDVTMTGVNKFFEALIAQARGEPSPSVTYQLRPVQTLLIMAGALAVSLFSYAVENTIMDKEMRHVVLMLFNLQVFHALRVLSDVSMDIYHTSGVMLFYHLIFSSFAQDPREKYIFSAEKALERKAKESLTEHIAFVENTEPAKRRALNLELFPSPDADLERGVEAVRTSNRSSRKSWCKMFEDGKEIKAGEGEKNTVPLKMMPG